MSYDVKQIIVIRKDLKMRRGKEIAQGAHASMAAILNTGSERYRDGYINNVFQIELTDMMREWLLGKFAKITATVDSEEELLALHKKAKDAGIITALITDSGFTEFNGVPTNTCIAIGPAHKDKLDPITGHLRLY